ncbi:MAG: trypsin-like peptidase domain-containing protein [Planctomycetes bacterium]|nr:trypsin-like peptidase domain-containing protein [Planctomycetota bacterium]
MPLRIRCPGCQALSDIPDTMVGQKLRCKQCQKVFQVGKPPAAKPKVAEPPAGPAKPKAVEPAAPPAKHKAPPPVKEAAFVEPIDEPIAEEEDGLQSRPDRKPARHPAPKMSAKPAARPREPRRRLESSSALKWIIAGVVALLLVGGGVGLAIFLSNRDDDKQTAEGKKKEAGKGDDNKGENGGNAPAKPQEQQGIKPAPLDQDKVLQADQAIPLKTLNELKGATVFIRVKAGPLSSSGSGFLVRVDGETGYLVTNHHVITPLRRGLPTAVTAVFWSGTRKEQSAPAVVLASDPQYDLAVLKVTGVKELPAPIDLSQKVDLIETMPVFMLGFPFGQALSTRRGNPGITIGKGTVSSLRTNEFDEVAFVQLDGDLNPGNSGGPVVDTKGRLVGIAVAKLRGTRIGMAIPPLELNRMLLGRVALIATQPRRVAGGVAEVDLRVRLIDPLNRHRTVQAYYVRADTIKEKPVAGKNGTWSALPGASSVVLEVKGQEAASTLKLSAAEKKTVRFLVQLAYSREGTTVFTAPHSIDVDFGTPVVIGPDRPPDPVVVTAPVLGGDQIVRELPSAVDDLCVGGGGRFLILHLASQRKLAIFDVNEAKVVKYLPVAEDSVKIAACLDKLIVILPTANLIQRYSLRTFERESSVPGPTSSAVAVALMGSASRGPLVLLAGKGFGQGEQLFLDPYTLKPLKEAKLGGGVWDPGQSFWRISGDGRVVTSYQPNLSPQGHTLHLRRGDSYKQTGLSADINFAGHMAPGPEGRFVYTARGVFTSEGKAVGKLGSYSDGSRYCLPAAEGESFYLRIDVPGFPHGDRARAGKLFVHLAGEDRPLAEVAQAEVPVGLNTWGREPFGADKHFYLIPSAKLLVVLPARQDRLVLHRLDVEKLLAKAEYDYLVVLSQAPRQAARGQTFAYTPVVKSKKGGVKLKVEAGPAGMQFAPGGKLTWNVPKDCAEKEVDVIVSASDASGQEVFHSFKLGIVDKAE